MGVLAVSSGLEALGGFLVITIGYGTVWGLWHFVFSERNRHDDDLPPQEPPELS
ncbi:MAG TPA: hypothetical protein VGG41_00450 [Solirubrobacteraceae bacterium]|jgi:hypothetical protein